jgi:hypothetical protein
MILIEERITTKLTGLGIRSRAQRNGAYPSPGSAPDWAEMFQVKADAIFTLAKNTQPSAEKS